MQSLINILRNDRNKPIYHQTIYYAIVIHHAGSSPCMNHVTSGDPVIGRPVDSGSGSVDVLFGGSKQFFQLLICDVHLRYTNLKIYQPVN